MPDLYPKFDMPDLVEAVEDTSIAYPKVGYLILIQATLC